MNMYVPPKITEIEAVGKNSEEQNAGHTEVEFWESVGFDKAKGIKEIRFLKSVFPNPLREIDSWYVPWSKRKIITDEDIRAGFFVIPEDLLDSKRTEEYFAWKYKGNTLVEI